MKRKNPGNAVDDNPNPKPQTEQPESTREQTESDFNEQIQEEMSAQLSELNDKIAGLNDKYLRLFSEFDNFRKRTARERIELSKTASEEVITALLPVLDDMERALQSITPGIEEDAFVEGIRLIYSKLKNILNSKGLEEIPSTLQEFDTDFHEAISHYPVEDPEKKNKIIEMVQKGYKLGDKVIRYAKVVVGL